MDVCRPGEKGPHHWLLDVPDNGTVRATCRHCGWDRTYPSEIEDQTRRGERLDRANTGEKANKARHAWRASFKDRNNQGLPSGHTMGYTDRVRASLEYDRRKDEIVACWQRHGEVKTAAKELGMPVASLYSRLTRWGERKPKAHLKTKGDH